MSFLSVSASTLAMVSIGATVASTAVTGIMQRNAQKAQTQQIEMAQRANTSAVQQAEKDKQREIDMAVYQQDRENRRSESLVKANQANAGIAGITASRQIDNATFQNILDINYIRTQGENSLIDLSNKGFSQTSNLQSQLNTSKRNTASYLEIGASTAVAGIKSFASNRSSLKE